MAGGVDWKVIREDFPILRERAHGHPLIYFDSAATSQKPQGVLNALRNYYEHNNANVHRGLHELSSRATEAYETSRKRVAKYIRSFPQTREFIARISDLLIYLIPHYIHEGKSYLTISFGCTGGQHRSVMIAEDVAKRLRGSEYRVKVVHRDSPG